MKLDKMLPSPKAALTTQLLFLSHDAIHMSSSPMAALHTTARKVWISVKLMNVIFIPDSSHWETVLQDSVEEGKV